MNVAVKACLDSVRLGEAQHFNNITVVPLLNGEDGLPKYWTLGEGLESGLVRVTEASQAGSVPELRLTNQSEQAVLLLDGEELLGAKQNRVLNTTLLVKERSDLMIPVSCTEAGRWAYESPEFKGSPVVMAHHARVYKAASVSESLATQAAYHSDQAEVWEEIAALHAKVGSKSPTHAMHDAFLARQEELGQALRSFQRLPGQKGLLVLLDGKVAGFDFISRSDAYGRLHDKLVRSYVIGGLRATSCGSPGPGAAALAKAFLAEAVACQGKCFPSLGYGEDCRLCSDSLVGSALVHEQKVIHTAVFRADPGRAPGGLAGYRQRRRSHLG